MTTPRTPGRRRDVKKDKNDAILQKYNVELLHCLDEMKYKRDELHRDVISLKEEQGKLQSDILLITAQLAKVNESLCHKLAEKDECDRVISEYEDAFQRLIDGSENLLTSVRKAVQMVAPDVIIEEEEPSRTTSRQTRISTTSHPLHTPLTSRADTRGEVKSRLDSRQPSRADPRSDAEVTPR
ncbi:hypothetical protein FSP39_021313 [Pinctada imbricata]|uniref:Sjoegren syndrome nuclear autoantigen 1 n=1 Tax=Pinctada imbricata TaxID=66713 RepID=A0AA89CAA8_PINIB|nr:hypothetical protein FSP39_021313 [Pinctada imbricata]